jgi:hypothetical protein
MILHNQIHKPVKKMLAFFFRDPIDLLNMNAYGKNTLPARNRVGANHRVLSTQYLANILGRTTRSTMDIKIVLLSNFIEPRLSICRCQTLKELLVRLRDAVVDFVTGCPEGVYEV